VNRLILDFDSDGFHAPHGLLSSLPAKQIYHLLSQPDISCVTDIEVALDLTKRGLHGI
jgi:hypothetical protein